jgi:hypothetical protein
LAGNIVRAASNWPAALVDPGKRPNASESTEKR